MLWFSSIGKFLGAEDHARQMYLPSLKVVQLENGFSAGKCVSDGSRGQGDQCTGHWASFANSELKRLSFDPTHLHGDLFTAGTNLTVATWTCSGTFIHSGAYLIKQ